MRRVRQRGPSTVVIGAVTLAVIAVATFFGFTKANPFANPYEFKAAFRNASDIKPKSPVRIAGVNVGKVKKVERGEGDAAATVTMEIEDKGLPIHRDAIIKIRPRIFLEGNYFVDVSPGSPSAPAIEKGETVSINQTASPVGFGQLLETLQSDTRDDLRTVLDEYGRGLKGGAEGYNRSIRYQKRAFRDSAIVNDATLGEQPHDLSGYIDGAGAVAEALDRNPAQLKSLITDFATTADAFALQEANLSRAVNELPRTVTTGRSALGELNRAFPNLRRFVAAMRPAVRSSGPALDAALPFVSQMRGLVSRPELRGLVADLRPTVPNLVELNRGGVPLQQEQRLLSSCQNTVVLPTAEAKVDDPAHPATGPVYQDSIKWFPGIAGESRSFDANGQYIRTFAQAANYAYPLNDGRFFLSGLPIQGVNPPRVDKDPPLRPDVPCETQEPPDLRSKAQAPPAAIKVDMDSPAARARLEVAKKAAVAVLRRQLIAEGLDDKLKVSEDFLSSGNLAKARGGGG
jgi:virulence factor Mce-like protein